MSGRRLVVEADGGSRGNPGPAGFGAVVRDAGTGEVLAEVAEAIGTATNNVAEYRGLLAGLQAAAALDPDCRVEARLDSKLVVEQMSGRWKIKHEDMRRLAAQAQRVLPADRVRYTWVPRAQNSHADRLANEAMDAAAQGRTWQRTSAAPAPPPDTGEATTLVLVRHGRTALTEQRRLSGSGGSDPGLSEPGRDDAQRAARAVATIGRPGTAWAEVAPPGVVVTSPLRRARESAELVAAAGGGLPVEVDDALAEAAFGQWEGLTYAEMVKGWPDLVSRWQREPAAAPPGGESLEAVLARVRTARRRLVEGRPGRTVVVVSHLTPVRAVVADALDAGPAALWRLRVAPGSITVVRFWRDGGGEVATVNDVAHLYSPLAAGAD